MLRIILRAWPSQLSEIGLPEGRRSCPPLWWYPLLVPTLGYLAPGPSMVPCLLSRPSSHDRPTGPTVGHPQCKERANPTTRGRPLPADAGTLALLSLPVWLRPCCLWKPALSLWLLWSFPSASVVPFRGTSVPDQPIWIGARPLTGEVRPNPIYLKL